jgi:hypothetical protein
MIKLSIKEVSSIVFSILYGRVSRLLIGIVSVTVESILFKFFNVESFKGYYCFQLCQ